MGLLNDILGGLSKAGDLVTRSVEGAGDILGDVLDIVPVALKKTAPIIDVLQQAGVIPGGGAVPPLPQRSPLPPIVIAGRRGGVVGATAPISRPLGPVTLPVSGGGRTLATALPGGAPLNAGLGTGIIEAGLGGALGRLAPLAGGIALEQLLDLIPGGAGAGAVSGGLFRPTPSRVTPVRRIMAQNPQNPNRIEVWEHAGTPILFSRDLRCAKRVQKLARRARGRR